MCFGMALEIALGIPCTVAYVLHFAALLRFVVDLTPQLSGNKVM